MQKEKIRFFG